MEKITINKKHDSDTITQTIRWGGELYDKLQYLSYKNKVSFNYLVNRLIEYSLNNYIIEVVKDEKRN